MCLQVHACGVCLAHSALLCLRVFIVKGPKVWGCVNIYPLHELFDNYVQDEGRPHKGKKIKLRRKKKGDREGVAPLL